ncbi:MAG TPA: hypothetical protein VK154_11885 [Chitinophagales bacterium]|nr:hypothetical protein [Chitinophagales bacterium]
MTNLTTTTRNMKALFSFLVIALFANTASAQATMPVNKATGKVTYRFSIPVNENVSDEQAYEIAAEWFSRNTSEFTRSNMCVRPENMSGVNSKMLAEVSHEFNNTFPVQSLDPSSHRIAVRVVTKYFGDQGSNIHALYLQYYMIVTVADHKITCELSDIRYNHFNERSYQFKRIQNWSNSTSLDPVNTIEYIIENQQAAAEFTKFYSFFNKDVKTMVEHLNSAVKGAGVVAQN